MDPGQHTVLITGGASGIGFAIARKFVQHDNRVVIVGRSGQSLEAAAMALPGVETCIADVTVTGDRERLAATFPDTTVLVNSAGVLHNGLLSESSPQSIEAELAVNLIAPIVLSRLFLPELRRASSGAIVNVSSSLAIVPRERASVYSTSKAGLHVFSKTLRWQLEGTAIRVFEVLPPLVDTPMAAVFTRKKMEASRFADHFWRGFLADRLEMPIGRARMLSIANRFLPRIAELFMRRAE